MARYTTFESFLKRGKDKLSQEQIDFLDANCTKVNFLTLNNGTWDIDSNGMVTVHGNFKVCNKGLKNLMGIDFRKIAGDFDCSHNEITSLEGCPEIVGGDFNCSYNQIKSLKEGPSSVGGDYDCMSNEITSLEGCPEDIGGDFTCEENMLTSLQGGPETVKGDFICVNNQLTSLKGSPNEVGGSFLAQENLITNLDNFSIIIGENLDLTNNKITDPSKIMTRLYNGKIKILHNPFVQNDVKPYLEKFPFLKKDDVLGRFISSCFVYKTIPIEEFIEREKLEDVKSRINNYFF